LRGVIAGRDEVASPESTFADLWLWIAGPRLRRVPE
jgi:hypothetical protein